MSFHKNIVVKIDQIKRRDKQSTLQFFLSLILNFIINSIIGQLIIIYILFMGCLQNRPINHPVQQQNRQLNYQYSSSAYQTNPYLMKNKPTPLPAGYASNNPYNPNKLPTEEAYNQIDMMRRYGTNFKKNNTQFIDVKVPTTTQKIKFTISKQQMLLLPLETGNYNANIIKNLCFQEKMTWFRIQVEKMRISWESGCQWLQVDRLDVIQTSQSGLRNLNLRKQLKIKLSGQEVDDAGGVLREWMHLCVKDIFSSEIAGLFRLCKTDETAYRFIVEKVANQSQDEYRMELCTLLGIVIGKAFFDRIPLDCFLTRSIWRQICSQPVQICDFYSYDSDIYKNLKLIIETPNAEDLFLNFTYYVGESLGKEEEVPLKPNGHTITVDDQNKKEYANLLVDYLCVKSCQRYIQKIKQAINRILPLQILSIFQPHQMEMLLNGPQNIDVNDWRNSTIYINYKPSDLQVIWFWAYVEKLEQEKLGNLLHFVTGSRRVPILGFSFLESNRNKINKFTIQRCEIEEHNPYPKSHTCFNRLQLPQYSTQAELNLRMKVILQRQINSFGMS